MTSNELICRNSARMKCFANSITINAVNTKICNLNLVNVSLHMFKASYLFYCYLNLATSTLCNADNIFYCCQAIQVERKGELARQHTGPYWRNITRDTLTRRRIGHMREDEIVQH